jgi:amino acid transporter
VSNKPVWNGIAGNAVKDVVFYGVVVLLCVAGIGFCIFRAVSASSTVPEHKIVADAVGALLFLLLAAIFAFIGYGAVLLTVDTNEKAERLLAPCRPENTH